MVTKKNLSEIFSARFWDSHFYVYYKNSLRISHKMIQNNRKPKFSSMWLNLRRKTVFVNIYPLLLVWSKAVVTNPNFSQDLPLFKHGKKNKLSEYFSAPIWDSNFFWLKRKVLYEFPPKFFKTTERQSLAVYGSLCGEKQFFAIYSLLLLWLKTIV